MAFRISSSTTLRPQHDGSTPVSGGSRRRRFESALLATAALLGAPPLAHGGPLERVPQDGTLQEAIDSVFDGGVIEIAGGVYPAPAQGWRSVSGRRFTVRATGPDVVLDGQGSRRILLLRGQGAGAGRTVAFEGITFRGGSSTTSNRAGGVTIESAEAAFASCAFESNRHHADNGGGAVRIAGASDVRFTRCRFVDNQSQRWGAAIFAQDSSVEVTWSELTGNRTNVAGHSALSAGGAIFLLDSRLSVSRSRFTANEAGWVGGAIYSIGNWHQAAEGVPASRVTITDSVFAHNVAAPNPCCPVPGPPGGGAIHAEDQTDVLIRGSRFDENVAAWGGAISGYRALIEIEGSVFRGNRGEPTGTHVAAGGTINITSSDFSDKSTGFGAFNRRPAELHLRDSLLLGRFGATTHAAQQGGCLFVDGDRNRLYGNGVPQRGTAADNRARVKLDHVIFADCDIEARPGVQAIGGAILILLADLEMTSSQVFGGDSPASGGALLGLYDSRLIFRDSAFAGNTALDGGAGLLVNGGHVEIRDCLFVDNDVSPGVDESEAASQGSALVLARTSEEGITGVVERSVFSGNSGIPIEDRDSRTGTSNRVIYVDNRIHSPRFGPKAYKNTPSSFAALTVAELNSLVVQHADGPFDKGTGNSYLASPPAAGSLVAAPGAIARPTTAGDPSLASAFLGYVWSGTSAELAGDSIGVRTGLLEVTEPGTFELRVAGVGAASAAVSDQPCSRGQLLCLNQNRFLVEADWRDHSGAQRGRQRGPRRQRLGPLLVLQRRQLGDAGQGARRLRHQQSLLGLRRRHDRRRVHPAGNRHRNRSDRELLQSTGQRGRGDHRHRGPGDLRH